MQRQVEFLANAGNDVDLAGRIDRADFGCLGDRHAKREAPIDRAGREGLHTRTQGRRVDLAVVSGNGTNANAAGEKFRRAALILADMRFGMRESDAADTVDRGEGQRIAGGAGRQDPDRDLMVEDLGETRLDLTIQFAGAIGHVEAAGVSLQGVGDLRVGARPVV